MTNKIIIMSKLILFAPNDKLYSDSLSVLDELFEQGIKIGILARLNTLSILKVQIPDFYKENLIFIPRGEVGITQVNSLKENDTIISILGVVEVDALFAFQCRVPLFNAQKVIMGDLFVDKKISDYGLPISSFKDIIDCYRAFEINKVNYFRYDEGSHFTVVSINNANTMYKPDEEVRIKNIFEKNLKANDDSREHKILLLLLFQIINKIISDRMFDSVEFWGTFPSSTYGKVDTSANFLKEAIRVIVNGKPRAKAGIPTEIFIRHKSMQSKHNSGSIRLSNKCGRDFDTLILNPILRGKLRGKTVCIIDDYITNGYSAESAKHVLFKAGVDRVIFLSMGKFGKRYFQTSYQINGEVIEPAYPYTFLGENELGQHDVTMNYNVQNDIGILDFGDIL